MLHTYDNSDNIIKVLGDKKNKTKTKVTPLVIGNKSTVHCLKWRVVTNHTILTKYEAVHSTGVSQTYSSSGILKFWQKSRQYFNNLNYHVLGISTAAIFLSNDHSLYAPFTSDECHAWFHLYGTSQPARRASKATNIKKGKSLAHGGTQTHNLKICSLTLYRLSYLGFDESCPIKVTFINTCTSDTNVNDGVECILSCTCTVLCNILEYIYIAKRCTSPVFAFNV